ncbi:hypothetical protein B0H67DRAFT_648902 [Lasiosphaeris hirsuta]|uniref:Uncharacterized protein n=1 Tax=Lasiosphaeris hirsuta TaxID=260670 RepID=A0AA40DKT4_9PEZI|nr:hypothetical protein B0H67DRAFT_648902 [Lasiosphaeris hirsuta]
MTPIAAYNYTRNITTDIATATNDIGRYVLEAELIVVLGTLLPILSHPFLPEYQDTNENDKKGNNVFSFGFCFMQFFFIHAPNFFLGHDSPAETPFHIILPLWIVHLNMVCCCMWLSAGTSWIPRPAERDHTLDDFFQPAALTIGVLLFEVLRLLSTSFTRTTSSWILGLVGTVAIMGYGFFSFGFLGTGSLIR